MRPSSPASASWARPQLPEPSPHEGAESLGPPRPAQRSLAPFLLLGDPALYPLRLSHKPLDLRWRRVATAAAPGGPQLHSRVLARPPVDDPDGLAAARTNAP